MKPVINISRIIVGLLFIFSGLIKANDPLGLSYKMQEFFEVWGMNSLHDFTLPLSVLMNAFEIIAGVAILVGWQMRLFSWLLLLLILFFTFLTGYAVLTDKIKECGCFGNCIPLKAGQSFLKDLVLLGLIVLLFAYRKKIQPALSTRMSILILFFTTIFSFAFQWYTLVHLPVVDCLPFKKGNHIAEEMKIPKGAVPDSTVITFIYEVNGKEVEIAGNNFPDDFNDSTYKFIKRYDKLIRKGNAEPSIKDFSLKNPSGVDVTEQLLNAEGYKLFLFLKDGYKEDDWVIFADMIMKDAFNKGIPGFLITNVSLEELYKNPPQVFNRLNPLRCDATAIKTAARANPTFYLLKGDQIIEKWSYADFSAALKKIQSLH
jgi:uncharacterized membrane protein YphA (DoxX/SURF4 family)